MKKNNKLYIVWGVIVIVIVALLTVLGFMLKENLSDYTDLEEKLLDSAKKYVDNRFLYPEGKNTIKITSEELIENEFLDELQYEEDVCTGYVIVSFDGVYKYKAYMKCSNYTTKGYEK